MSDIVQCRICKQKIHKKKMFENIDWVMPSNRQYFHKECYYNWKRKAEDIHSNDLTEDMYKNSVFDFLIRNLRIMPNFPKVHKQWNAFLKQGKTAKGIYFSLKYYYEVMNGDISKAEGGIGIVPYVYEDAAAYWIGREKIEAGIIRKIEKQIEAKEKQSVTTIYKNPVGNKRKKISLEEIEMMEDEE